MQGCIKGSVKKCSCKVAVLCKVYREEKRQQSKAKRGCNQTELALPLDVELVERGIQSNLVFLVGQPADWPGLNVALKVTSKLVLLSVPATVHPEAAARIFHVPLVRD